MAEREAAVSGQRKRDLEVQMAQLREELEASQKQLGSQQENSSVEQSKLETRIQELQATKLQVEQQIKGMKEALAEETKRRKVTEHQSGEIGARRNELEAQLAPLRQELEASQKQLRSHQESSSAEQASLQGQFKEWDGAKSEVELEVKRLTEALGNETQRRENAESRAGETGLHRSDLESELAKNKQAQAPLRQELESAQKQLRSQL